MQPSDLQSNAQLDISQNIILPKIQTYLRNNGRDEKFIQQFGEGYCSGISSLWVYSKWLEPQQKGNNPRDDYEWFESTVRLIAGWDGERSLTFDELAEFERFISHIEYFQNIAQYLPVAQGDLDQSLQDTKRRKPSREYSIASLFTLDQLKQLLNTEGIIQENKLILISSHNHDAALFRRGEN